MRAQTDPHSPPEYRINGVVVKCRNLRRRFRARGQPMVKPAEDLQVCSSCAGPRGGRGDHQGGERKSTKVTSRFLFLQVVQWLERCWDRRRCRPLDDWMMPCLSIIMLAAEPLIGSFERCSLSGRRSLEHLAVHVTEEREGRPICLANAALARDYPKLPKTSVSEVSIFGGDSSLDALKLLGSTAVKARRRRRERHFFAAVVAELHVSLVAEKSELRGRINRP